MRRIAMYGRPGSSTRRPVPVDSATRWTVVAQVSITSTANSPFAETPFGEFAEEWYGAVVPRLEPNTRVKYRSYLDNHLLPQWRLWPMIGICNGYVEIERWLTGLHDEEYAESSIASIFATFSTILNAGVRAKTIPANRCYGIRVTGGEFENERDPAAIGVVDEDDDLALACEPCHHLERGRSPGAEDTGALFVIAAGNDQAHETVTSPGTADRARTVGAVDKTAPHSVARYSFRGPRILDRAVKAEITAPCTGIVAAKTGGGYVSLQGTSMASPHVAGAAAILAQQHPDWTAEQLKGALVSTADPTSPRE